MLNTGLPKITIEGTAGLIAVLKELGEKELPNAVRKGLRAAGTNTAKKARGNLHKNHGLDTGLLKKSLGIRKIVTLKGAEKGKFLCYIGPRLKGFAVAKKGRKRPHTPFYIGHLVEFGHRIAQGGKLDRFNKKGKVVRKGTGGRVTGMVRGRPFLRPAVDSSKGDFTNQLTDKMREVLNKARARRGK